MLSGEEISASRVTAAVAAAAPAPATARDLAGRRLPKLRADLRPQVAPVPLSSAIPAWLRALDAWQRSLRHPLPIALDVAIVTATTAVVTGSASVALWTAGTFLGTGMLFGLWKSRSSVAAQGVSWYFKPLAPCLLLMGAALAASLTTTPFRSAAVTVVVVFGALASARTLLWLVVGACRRHGRGLKSALIVGPRPVVEVVEHRIAMFPECGLFRVASYTPRSGDGATAWRGKALVEQVIQRHAAEHVVLIATDIDEPICKDFVGFNRGHKDLTVVYPLARVTDRSGSRIGELRVSPVPMRGSWGSAAAKRAFDVVGASILLAIMSPFLALVAVAVRLGDPGPAIFKQLRTGWGGRVFTVYKFRSMVVDACTREDEFMSKTDGGAFSLKVFQDPRVTKVGKFIRRYSIDELPQLVNVIKGDMSLVGPRPLPFHPGEFDPRAHIRHAVRPGMTGLWQVSGANALTDSDMLELDLSYVVHHSLGMDLTLLLKTLPVLIVRRDLY